MATFQQLRAEIDARLAEERGTIVRQAPWRVALLYPSPYRVGMSSLGFQAMYGEINRRPDWVAERAFLPDDPKAYRSSRTPLFTYENRFPISEAAVVAVSLAYELEIPGLLESLDLAGIPVRAADRTEHDPLVILGGPLTFSNPVPIGPFVDAVVVGEGESLVHEVLDIVADSADRDETLTRLSALPHVHVPAIHGERLLAVAKADDGRLPARSSILTPNTELANMHLVEAERGCHRQCTFCVMRRSTNDGMRLIDPQTILDTVPEYAERVGLVGAAVSDHPRLPEILRGLVDAGRSVGISSLRADRLTPELVDLLQRGGYRTLTVASDGASERLRKELRKKIRAKHLRRAAEYVAEYELRQLKLYMMIGLPEETEEDLDELIEFSRELSTICKVSLGVAPFVSKRNTPMDRAPYAGIKPVERTLKKLATELKGRVDVRSTSARWAWVEWCLAQGGFDMADAAEEAWRNGGSFGAWKRAIKTHMRDEQPVDTDLRLGIPRGRFVEDLGYPRAPR